MFCVLTAYVRALQPSVPADTSLIGVHAYEFIKKFVSTFERRWWICIGTRVSLHIWRQTDELELVLLLLLRGSSNRIEAILSSENAISSYSTSSNKVLHRYRPVLGGFWILLPTFSFGFLKKSKNLWFRKFSESQNQRLSNIFRIKTTSGSRSLNRWFSWQNQKRTGGLRQVLWPSSLIFWNPLEPELRVKTHGLMNFLGPPIRVRTGSWVLEPPGKGQNYDNYLAKRAVESLARENWLRRYPPKPLDPKPYPTYLKP